MAGIWVPKFLRDLFDVPAPEEGSAVRWGSNGVLTNERFGRPVTPSAVLWESAEVPVPQAPGAVLINEIVDMARYALTLAQDAAQPMVVLTKAGPGGTRVTTSSGVLAGPGDPAADAPLTNMVFGFCFPAGDGEVDPDNDPPGVSWGAQDFPVIEGSLLGAVNAEIGNLFHGNRQRFVRAYAARNAVAYTPEEWAQIQAADYRVKLQLLAPVQQVAEWTFPVPAAAGALICNQVIDLQRYGMTLGFDDCKFTATFERDGQVIRGYPGIPGVSRDWPTYTGEAFDPPTYPVEMDFRAWYPGYEHEIPNSARAEWFRYGSPASGGGGYVLPGADAFASVSFGACTRDMHSTLLMRAWRTADVGAADYVPAEGQPPIPVPAGAKDGCVLRVRLFRPHRLRQGYYPWLRNTELGETANITVMKRRTQLLDDRVSVVEGRFPSGAAAVEGLDGLTIYPVVPGGEHGAAFTLRSHPPGDTSDALPGDNVRFSWKMNTRTGAWAEDWRYVYVAGGALDFTPGNGNGSGAFVISAAMDDGFGDPSINGINADDGAAMRWSGRNRFEFMTRVAPGNVQKPPVSDCFRPETMEHGSIGPEDSDGDLIIRAAERLRAESPLEVLGAPVGRKVAVPASATAPGALGDFACDGAFAYFCTAPDTWVRCAVATW